MILKMQCKALCHHALSNAVTTVAIWYYPHLLPCCFGCFKRALKRKYLTLFYAYVSVKQGNGENEVNLFNLSYFLTV